MNEPGKPQLYPQRPLRWIDTDIDRDLNTYTHIHIYVYTWVYTYIHTSILKEEKYGWLGDAMVKICKSSIFSMKLEARS